MASPAHSNTATAADSKTVSRPTGTGGILVLIGAVYDDTSVAQGDASPPSGDWTLRSFVSQAGTEAAASWVWTKPADGGDASTFTWTGPSGYSETACSRYTHDDGAPEFDAAGTPVGESGTSPTTIPAVTTTGDERKIVAVRFGYDSAVTATPTDFTQRAVWDTVNYIWDREAATAGTYGPTNVTFSGTEGNNVHAIALKAPAGGGGGATVEPGVASLTTTRFAPTVLTPRTVTPGVRSLVTAGQAPTVLTPRVVAPGLLSLSTSLLAPTVQTPRTVSPGVLSLVTAGQTPTVLTPRMVSPGVAALTTSGQAPTVTTGGNVAVEPGLAELVTSLFAPTVLTPRVVEPGVLSLTTSGQAPTVLTPRTVMPGVLALVTSLFAPTVATPRVVTPGAASLVLAAFAPVLLLPVVAAPGVATLTLTAFVPVVSNGEVILVPGTVVVFDKPAGSVLVQDWAPEAAVRDALAGHLLVGDGP